LFFFVLFCSFFVLFLFYLKTKIFKNFIFVTLPYLNIYLEVHFLSFFHSSFFQIITSLFCENSGELKELDFEHLPKKKVQLTEVCVVDVQEILVIPKEATVVEAQELKPKDKKIIIDDENEFGFNKQDMRDTASVVLSGLQYEKYEEFMILTKHSYVSQKTYYRYLPVVERVIDKLWKEEQERIERIIKEKKKEGTLGELLVAIDGAWHKRGHTSELGNFAGVIISCHPELNNKVMYASNRTMSRKKMIKGKEKVVHEGNHKGTSKSMEGELFLDMLDWLGLERVISIEKQKKSPKEKIKTRKRKRKKNDDDDDDFEFEEESIHEEDWTMEDHSEELIIIKGGKTYGSEKSKYITNESDDEDESDEDKDDEDDEDEKEECNGESFVIEKKIQKKKKKKKKKIK